MATTSPNGMPHSRRCWCCEALVAGGAPLGQRLDALQRRCGLYLHYDRVDLRLQDMAARARLQDLLGHGLPTVIAGEPVREVLRQDGVKLRMGAAMGHWLMLRFSGTEPLLRLYCEAPSRERLDHRAGLGQGPGQQRVMLTVMTPVMTPPPVLIIASGNAGKVREFTGALQAGLGGAPVAVRPLPGPLQVEETGGTFPR